MKGNILWLATEAAEAVFNTAMSGAVALCLLVYLNSFVVGPPAVGLPFSREGGAGRPTSVGECRFNNTK